MKKKFLFCTNPLMYLTEVPVIVLFLIALRYNKYSVKVAKFYPLMIFLVISMCFIFLYLFRMISISFEEIKYHGLFSSRDRADIDEGKELIITVLPKMQIKVDLFGNYGELPELSWIKPGVNDKPRDIFLFRGKAIGTKRTVISLLRYFGVEEADLTCVLEKESFEADYESVHLVSKKEEDQITLRLKMKETV